MEAFFSFCSLQYGFYCQQNKQLELQQNQTTNEVSIQELIQDFTQFNQSQSQQNETTNQVSFQEQIQNSSVIDEDLKNLFKSLANPIEPLY